QTSVLSLLSLHDALPIWLMADFKTYQIDDAEVQAMKTALAAQPAEADRMQLHFALGRACDQRGEHEAAFAHYAAGNAPRAAAAQDRKSTRLNSSHVKISY